MNSLNEKTSPSLTLDQKNSERSHPVGDIHGEPATSRNLREASLVSPLQTTSRFNEEWSLSSRGSSIIEEREEIPSSTVPPGNPLLSVPENLRKASVKRKSSINRSASRRSTIAGSVRSLAYQPRGNVDEIYSAFFSPIPTNGNPTEFLADRFQAWRKVLKDTISNFKEIQAGYDHRVRTSAKAIYNLNSGVSTAFLRVGGINDAAHILGEYFKTTANEAKISQEIEDDIISGLTGLRNDLQCKIKEIKNLSGDFKNSVEKEMESTRKSVDELQESLELIEVDPAQVVGKKDPYLLKLATDSQIEKQISEENYLHQAYLNLEASGRELEAIIVCEIQRSYNAYANILKREASIANATADELQKGPLAIPKDHEWDHFTQNNTKFFDPNVPVRHSEDIQYPGKDNELAKEIKSGPMERKSKYLKSPIAGWYVLSPTHLHEFKSADKTLPPVMSLYLPEQKLGPHSDIGSASNKFVLKGRQTGAMHRDHSWVFRCGSYETMMSWYQALKILIEKFLRERDAYVRSRARSLSGKNKRASSVGSSDEVIDDDDEEPFFTENPAFQAKSTRPDLSQKQTQPRGRFPSSDLLNDGERLQRPYLALSDSGENSGSGENSCFKENEVTSPVGDGTREADENLPVRFTEVSIPGHESRIKIVKIQETPDKNTTEMEITADQGHESAARLNLSQGSILASKTVALQAPNSEIPMNDVVDKTSPAPQLHVPGEWTKAGGKADKAIEG